MARRKARLKLAWEENPQMKAVSTIDMFSAVIMVFARSRRLWLTKRGGGTPVADENTRVK
jgi:hypothetical protein